MIQNYEFRRDSERWFNSDSSSIGTGLGKGPSAIHLGTDTDTSTIAYSDVGMQVAYMPSSCVWQASDTSNRSVTPSFVRIRCT